MEFSKDIREIRKKCFSSHTVFAKELRIAFTTVSRCENRKSKASYNAIKQIDQYCKNNNINFDISTA